MSRRHQFEQLEFQRRPTTTFPRLHVMAFPVSGRHQLLNEQLSLLSRFHITATCYQIPRANDSTAAFYPLGNLLQAAFCWRDCQQSIDSLRFVFEPQGKRHSGLHAFNVTLPRVPRNQIAATGTCQRFMIVAASDRIVADTSERTVGQQSVEVLTA